MPCDHSSFVERHLRSKLHAEGYKDSDINHAVHIGVQHYQQSSNRSQGIFTECLKVAKQYLKGTKKAS